MYVESDFILALLKEDDWLSKNAMRIYENEDNLWTSRYTLIEMMLVAYREDRNVLKTIAEVIELIEVKEGAEEVESAAAYVEEEGLTPFDALHLVASGDDKIASSDQSYDSHSERVELEDSDN